MKTHEILFQTLSQADDYVNGEQLAKELGVSRTSIWKAIQRLEKEGVVIESLKKKGYKLISGDILLPEVIASNTHLNVSLNEHCSSTQLDAKLGMEANHEGNTLYLANSQSAGKGRFGRSYYCPDQGGIYMSLHLKPQLPPAELPPYTLMVAAAICKAIKNLTLIDVSIKWVNDIYYREKKIGGILTEAITSIETGLVTDVIIGVGFNMAISTFPEELKTKAGSLFEGPCPITRNSLICEIWKEFFQTDVDELVYLYKERSLVPGRTVTFEQNQQTYQGIAKDISDTGQLLVQLDKKKEIWLNSGEISLTKW